MYTRKDPSAAYDVEDEPRTQQEVPRREVWVLRDDAKKILGYEMRDASRYLEGPERKKEKLTISATREKGSLPALE